MSTLTDALERILNWLRANYPEAASSLQPGLSYDEIEAKIADLPFCLPQEVYELYQWRNGSKEDGQEYIFINYKNYAQTHQKLKLADGSILNTLYNPHSGLVAETRIEDINGKLKEQTSYLGKQIIRRNIYRDRSEEFESYYSCDRWYASHDKYEEFKVLIGFHVKNKIQRRYINGILKKEIIYSDSELKNSKDETIFEIVFLIIGLFLFLIAFVLIFTFIYFILASLITIIKWLMGEDAIAIYL
jgi:hypothetical protein